MRLAAATKIHRAQTKHGKDIACIDQEGILRDRKNRRYAVEGKHDVRGLNHHQAQKGRSQRMVVPPLPIRDPGQEAPAIKLCRNPVGKKNWRRKRTAQWLV